MYLTKVSPIDNVKPSFNLYWKYIPIKISKIVITMIKVNNKYLVLEILQVKS